MTLQDQDETTGARRRQHHYGTDREQKLYVILFEMNADAAATNATTITSRHGRRNGLVLVGYSSLFLGSNLL